MASRQLEYMNNNYKWRKIKIKSSDGSEFNKYIYFDKKDEKPKFISRSPPKRDNDNV